VKGGGLIGTGRRWTVALLLVVAVSWLTIDSSRGLYNPDEGRYAEIPREMLATGDWLLPRLNGLVYIEKPPLQYWVGALSLALFGYSEWAARLYAALSGIATVLVTAWLARRLWGAQAAWRSGIMLASSLYLMLMSHQLTLDMSLTLFTTLTLAAFCMAQREETLPGERPRWMWLAWGSAACAFLTKGLLAGVLPVLTLSGYSLLQRDFRPWRRLALAGGLPLFLIIAVPWLVLMQRRLPQFFDFFIVREHFRRFTTQVEHRYQPWWFFIMILAIGSLPWLVPFVRALALDWRRSAPPGEFDSRRLLWIWSVVVLAFFSASDSKLIPYILPMFPALALLGGSAPEGSLRRDLKATGLGLLAAAGACIAGAALLPELLLHFSHPERAPYFLELRGPLVLMACALAAGGWYAWRRPALLLQAAAIGASSYIFFAGLLWAAALLAPIYSGASLARQLTPDLKRSATIYSVGTYDQSLTFYLRRTVTLVDYRGELDFGLSLEPQKGLATVEDFMPRWRAEQQALAVMKPETYTQLAKSGLPMVPRASAPGELIVSRR
jgi:4-amino-4-deoxy-L-arabinose transferase-like glycosyltransferase